ncbi:hypothetical protein CERSUDRAFT_65137 [Gelatoporia subvermispora B]|uniref:Mid2 domain-containing protein n=1 Tax=Ceriporiopsis subvermispora (strain B) TaxID=914234 RepID=M2RFA5_CERS8|nr:hypothetical protein CERSUDRAFT_65137 [Gelatoporia subvermispora B]
MLLRLVLPALGLAMTSGAAPASHLMARSNDGLPFSKGVLIGIIVGGVALVVVIIVLIVVIVKRRRGHSRKPSWSQDRFVVNKPKPKDEGSRNYEEEEEEEESQSSPFIPLAPELAHPTPLRPGSLSISGSRPGSTLSSHPLLRFDPPTPRSSHYGSAPSPTAAQHIASVSTDTLPNPHSLQPSTLTDGAETASIATLPNPYSREPSSVTQDDDGAPPASPTSSVSAYSMFSDVMGVLSRNSTRASRRVPSFKSYQRTTAVPEHHSEDDEEENHETPLLSNDKMEMPVPQIDGYKDDELR